MNAVLLTSDLMILSRVEGMATRNGFSLRTAATLQQAVEQLAIEPAELLLVDLGTPSLDVGELLPLVRSSKPYIVAFGPHVHEARLNAARQAGCDQVVSRGQFLLQLDAMLDRFRTSQSG
jgi:DNA-binding response OmpR family regulator